MLEIEYELIKKTLKKTLKLKGISYADLAEKLSVSEITIKRIFSKNSENYSGKLFEICEALDISFFNLVEMAKDNKKEKFSLTPKQDHFFCKNIGYFAVFREVYRKRPLSEIKRKWRLNENQLFKILYQLEKLGMIEVLENNAVKILSEGVLELDKNTNFEIMLRSILTEPFLKQFENPFSDDVFYHNSEIEMSHETKIMMMKELDDIRLKYCELGLRDKNILDSEKLISVRWLIAFSEYQTDWKKLDPKQDPAFHQTP